MSPKSKIISSFGKVLSLKNDEDGFYFFPQDDESAAILKKMFKTKISIDELCVQITSKLYGEKVGCKPLFYELDGMDEKEELSAFIKDQALKGIKTWNGKKCHLLKAGTNGQETFKRKDLLQIMALAAIGLRPVITPEQQKKIPMFQLSHIWSNSYEKTSFLLNYFNTLRKNQNIWEEKLILERRCVPKPKNGIVSLFENINEKVVSVTVEENRNIEDMMGYLQADFANSFLGGGVLQHGCAQEEIRFLISPECIAFMPMVEAMNEDEAIIMRGCIQYSFAEGYGRNVAFGGTSPDASKLDEDGVRDVTIVAFDALKKPGPQQFTMELVHRELWKAYVAFSAGKPSRNISTGNWGSGAFGGDPQLKFIIQWLAASAAKKDMTYIIFDDKRMENLEEVVALASRNGIFTIGQLYAHLQDNPSEAYETLSRIISNPYDTLDLHVEMAELELEVNELEVPPEFNEQICCVSEKSINSHTIKGSKVSGLPNLRPHPPGIGPALDSPTSRSNGIGPALDSPISRSHGIGAAHDSPTSRSHGIGPALDSPISRSQGIEAALDSPTSRTQGIEAALDSPISGTVTQRIGPALDLSISRSQRIEAALDAPTSANRSSEL